MKISMSLLACYLERYAPICDLAEERLEISGVRFLSDQRLQLSSKYVYLGQAEGYFSDEEYAGACILASGNSRMICLNCDYEELLNDILAAFDYYNEWEQELRQATAIGVELAQVIKIASKVIRNPIMVFDMEGNLLNGKILKDDYHIEGFDYIAKHRHMDAASLSTEIVDDKGMLSDDLTDYPQRLYRSGLRKESAVAFYLKENDERLGFCLIGVEDEREALLDLQMAAYLAPYFLKADEFAGVESKLRSNVSILSQLLAGKQVTQEAIEKFLHTTGLEAPWSLLVLKNLTVRNYTQRSMLVRDIKAAGVSCFALEYDGDVILLAQQNKCEVVLQSLDAMIGLNKLRVGISLPLRDLRNLPMACRQSRFALSCENSAGVFYCKSYALSYLLDGLKKQEMVPELIHPAIGFLEQHDSENQTELLKTLSVYMQEERNQVSTAELLHIHRNTLKYRLERIRKLTDINFSDGEERAHLYISLLIYNNGVTQV